MSYQEPEFLPWDGRRVPVTLLGGYLGAGKTTLINELLRRSDRPIAVLVNDVGAVNVDAKLLRPRNRNTIEFTDGCVCCSLSDGLGRAFDELRAQEQPPDHVVLELSGVAEPSRVVPWTASAGFRLDGVVVLVDAEQFCELESHDVIGNTMRSQVGAADLLVLTKLDLASDVEAEHTRQRLEQLAPATPIVDADADAAGTLLALGARHPEGEAALPAPTLFDAHRTEIVPLPHPIERPALEELLAGLPADTLRAKGIAETTSGEQLVIQVVGRRRSVVPLLPSERSEPTDLVVIRPAER
ncbi:MAG: GTP-binding protein [Acidimicrobiales bacterium]